MWRLRLRVMRVSDTIRLRPHPSLLSRGLIAAIAFLGPVFLVLYYLTAPEGPWLFIVYLQVAASLLIGIAVSRYFGTAIWVDANGISERGFFRRKTRFDASQVGSVVFVITLYSSLPQGAPQLFICGHEGHQLVRMRGRFWPLAAMDTVMNTLNAPLVRLPQPMTSKEIHGQYPGIGYWFERRPVLAVLLFVVSSVIGGAISILVAELVGPLPGD
ncbi:hypothetical protein GCM10007382_08100 [Salinibacterium xinjiangense]|nr:hypothetical protein GCM10007382_08100 [Salinibacterium xinjiangense]